MLQLPMRTTINNDMLNTRAHNLSLGRAEDALITGMRDLSLSTKKKPNNKSQFLDFLNSPEYEANPEVYDSILMSILNSPKYEIVIKIERFMVRKITIADKKTFHFDWINVPMKANDYESAIEWHENHKTYEPIDPKEIDAYAHIKFPVINSRHDKSLKQIYCNQLISLCHSLNKQRSLGSVSRMPQVIDACMVPYTRGESSIVDLAKLHRVSPTRLLQGILLRKRINEKNLDNMFRCRINPESVLNGRDLEQFKLAEANDDTSGRAQLLIDEIAATNESTFLKLFSGFGIKYMNQEELIATQIREHGRAVATPDMLFVDEVYINGERIYWIDFKNYLGVANTNLYLSTCAQVKKYFDKWGKGAICYKNSSVEGLTYNGAIVLDASMIIL